MASTPNDTLNLVYVVDDDELVRETLVSMLETLGYEAHTFEDGISFLQGLEELKQGIVLIDVNMPKLSGIEVSKSLSEQGCGWPVIIMSGQADIPMAVEAMKRGAIEFIEKPFSIGTVAKALEESLAGSRVARRSSTKKNGKTPIEKMLSQREIEVLRKLVAGQQNKEIARSLDISHRTVEAHRANIMRHLNANNFAELIKLSILHGIDEE